MKFPSHISYLATAWLYMTNIDALMLKDRSNGANSTSIQDTNNTIFLPLPLRALSAQVVPTTDLPILPYVSNASNSIIHVNHTMRYPSVLVETISSVSNVDCSDTFVTITFNNSQVFAETKVQWSDRTFVLVTNHLGDCDIEGDRGFFLVESIEWNNTTLVATATSTKSDLNSTAAFTKVHFGQPSNTTALVTRDITLDPSFTLSPAVTLPSTVLYSYEPYLTVTADSATFSSNATFSGYLAYNWLTFTVDTLYFDLNLALASALTLSAAVTSAYNTSFTYSPSSLFYGITVSGLLELGPELQFSVEADVSASEAVTLTTSLGIEIADGNVHLDLLDQNSITTSGWTPTYSDSANVSGQVAASLNPVAALTVELAIDFFGGLLDLSSGITAKPGFDNEFILTGAEGVDLSGVTGTTNTGTCAEGLELSSNFTFGIEAFVTQFWSDEVYEVVVPIFDECYSWE